MDVSSPAPAQPIEFWRTLADDHPAPVWVFDPVAQTVLDANAAALAESGYDRGEIVGRSWGEVAFVSTTEQSASGPVRWSQRTKDGRERVIAGNLRDVTFDGQPALALRATGPSRRHDLLLDALGQFAGGVAHEFNNLLTVIGGYADLIQTQITDGPTSGYLGELRLAVQRAAQRTTQLLAFGRRQALLPQRVDINEMVGSMAERLRDHLGTDVELIVELCDGLGPAFADADQIARVLMVLAENACEAMPLGGTLTIATEDAPNTPAGPAVCVRVDDTGGGMIEPVRRRLFEPFFTTKGPNRDGLGLATAYGAVAQCGGQIEVESTPGEGSTFRVYWPRQATASEVQQAGTAEGALGTILLVEDDIRVRSLLGVVLRQEGFAVLEAADARGALDIWDGHASRIGLLLTDMFMPVLNGRDLAARLRAQSPALPVIYMTGYSEAQLLALGAIPESEGPVLRKPFRPEALVQLVRHSIDKSSSAGR